MPTRMRWVATMMEPRWGARRWTVTGLAGGGRVAARRAPLSRSRSAGGTGPGMVRRSSPSWLMTAICVPVHAQRDALASEFGADVHLPSGLADEADGIDHPLDLDRDAGPGGQRRWAGRAGAVGGQTR